MRFDEDEWSLFGGIGGCARTFDGSDDLLIASFDRDDVVVIERVVDLG